MLLAFSHVTCFQTSLSGGRFIRLLFASGRFIPLLYGRFIRLWALAISVAAKASVPDNAAATLPPFAARRAAWLEAVCILHSGRLSDSERDGAVVCSFARHHFCLVARSISFVRVSDRLFFVR